VVDEQVGVDSLAQFIDACVAELYLPDAGFLRLAPKATGSPSYAPAHLVKRYPSTNPLKGNPLRSSP
jgi:hypothetical protein